MPITTAELVKSLTGAASDNAAQASAAASLGHFRSSTVITSGNDNNLFDDVSGAEAAAGHTDYRCLVFQNTDGALDLTTAKVFVETDDSNADTTYSLCLERPQTTLTAGAAQTIGNEATAPDITNATYHTSGAWNSLGVCAIACRVLNLNEKDSN
jgi:hypothetical protein